MTEFIVRRLFGMLGTLMFVAVAIFVLTNVIPGSPAAQMLGEEATREQIQDLERRLGIDGPLIVRLAQWVGRVLQGDLGTSLYTNASVVGVMLGRVEPTLLLALCSIVLAISGGVPLGVMAAVHRGKWLDFISMNVALVGVSVPNFWLGLNLMLLFSLVLGWLPAVGYEGLARDPMRSIKQLIMPAIALGLSHMGLIARVTRTNVLEILGSDYVRTARSKGLRERVVIFRHALRNAMVSTLSVIGVSIALMAGGSVIVETVFAIPGVGRLLIESVHRRDYPMIQGVMLLIVTTIVLVNLAIDLLYGVLDPRIRYQ